MENKPIFENEWVERKNPIDRERGYQHFDGGDIRGGKVVLPANKYRCVHCGKIVMRETEKKWIPSWCEETGKNVRLQLINK